MPRRRKHIVDETSSSYENRRFSRVPVVKPVTIIPDKGKSIEAKTQNVSALGLCATSETPLLPGVTCTVCFHLEEAKEIEIKGTIMHADATRLGIEITAIRADTVINLRDLILASADNPEETDEELISRPGFPPLTY